ncbi:MAG: hypothetical protein ACP5OE_07620 [Thermodesulfobium sp.]
MAREHQNLRGRGRFQGRGNAQRSHGGGRKSQYTRSRTSSPVVAQQKAIQFAPNVQGKINTTTYQTVKDAIIQHIQKTFQDGQGIAQSLKNGKKVDLSKILKKKLKMIQ